MSVKTYSYKKDGNKQLSKNFKVKEFVCKDKSDTIKIDSNLVTLLQTIRDHYNKPVDIWSGYRTKAYNNSIGGATKSQHMTGRAADIHIANVKPRDLAIFCEKLNPGGLGLYEYGGLDGFVHIDTRSTRARWIQKSPNSSAQSSSGFYADGVTYKTLRKGDKGEDVVTLQKALTKKGYSCAADGIFGSKTEKQVKKFQKANKLVVDGVVGRNTWLKLEA